MNSLPELHRLCNQFAALLIIDDVMTWFRIALDDIESYYQVKPNLTCLGKIIDDNIAYQRFY
ncbi:MAG: hypothetical protein ACTS7E_00465 [Arsenophonus sp. NC-CH8-MAG3]